MRHAGGLSAIGLMLLSAACAPEDASAPEGVATRKRESVKEAAVKEAEPKRAKPRLLFTFRVGAEPVLVLSSLEDPAEVVFEAKDGQRGEILRSAQRRENGVDRNYCEVRADAGIGWVPEEFLADAHWASSDEPERASARNSS